LFNRRSLACALRLSVMITVASQLHGSDAVDVAEQLRSLGKKYDPGAKGPDKFDCSGLVQYSFYKQTQSVPRCIPRRDATPDIIAKDCGNTQLPPGAGQQYYSSVVKPVDDATCPKVDYVAGVPPPSTCSLNDLIKRSKLERGDLLFFYDTDPDLPSNWVTHVGLYEGPKYPNGDHFMISALDTGYNIWLSDVSSDYWNKHFMGAGRVQAPGVTYTYTGRPFNYFSGTPGVNSSNFISASVTMLCPVPATYVDLSTVPLQSWSFNDGVHSISSSDATSYLALGFYVSADSSGVLNDWFFPPRIGSSNSMWVRAGWQDEVQWNNSAARSLGSGSWSAPSGTNVCATGNYVKYSYTGNPMNSSNLAGTGSLTITAFFVVPAPLAASQAGVYITPLAWGLTDSYYTMNFGNGDQLTNLQVWTDSQGAITGWNFSASGKPLSAGGGTLSTTKTPASTGDTTNVSGLFWSDACGPCIPYTGQNINNPGTWIH
jgi:cell wall-associated NlpC family hydrolase